MDRQEAVKVLREILGECNESLLLSCVSLWPTPTTQQESSSFELRINCWVDDYLRKCINSVLTRHKLAMKELGNAVVFTVLELKSACKSSNNPSVDLFLNYDF